ncbi:MAG: kinase/pyrophosphorylase [Deltaproteobacteria bacterium]|nr:kinase/pyrophosphorylase [Deltaproteobacteria bacterium]
MKESYQVFAVSDVTGEMAMNVAFAAMRQFKVENVSIVRKPHTRDLERIEAVVQEAKRKHAIILFTFVGKELRQQFAEVADQHKVVAVDLMGPVMDVFSNFFHTSPSSEPGLKYKQTAEYFKRQESIEFTVKHDDGMGLDTLHEADLVLVGISRTSKTPLSIYLSYRGYKVANVPIVRGVPIPKELASLPRGSLVGLTINPSKLVELRESRLMKLGRPLSEEYASFERIGEELKYCRQIFDELGSPPVIDVTGKAIEEIATEVLLQMGK